MFVMHAFALRYTNNNNNPGEYISQESSGDYNGARKSL